MNIFFYFRGLVDLSFYNNLFTSSKKNNLFTIIIFLIYI